MKKLIPRIIINTIIGLVLIYAWTQFVDVAEVFAKLKTVNPLILIAVIITQTAATIFRVIRFRILLPDRNIGFNQLTMLTFFSQLLTFVIPIRLGEFAKGIYISNQTKRSLTSSILWVFVDRLVDFWVVIFIIGILLFIVQTGVPQNITWIIGSIAVILSIGMVITVYYSELIKKIAAVVLKLVFIKRLRELLLTFSSHIIDAFGILKVSPQKQFLIVLSTFLSWFVESLSWYIIFLGLGVGNASLLAVLLGTMLMALSFILPSAPGYLGSMQAAGLLVFGLWLGFDPVTVSAATILLHLAIILYILTTGVFSVYFLKLDVGALFKRFNKSELKFQSPNTQNTKFK